MRHGTDMQMSDVRIVRLLPDRRNVRTDDATTDRQIVCMMTDKRLRRKTESLKGVYGSCYFGPSTVGNSNTC